MYDFIISENLEYHPQLNLNFFLPTLDLINHRKRGMKNGKQKSKLGRCNQKSTALDQNGRVRVGEVLISQKH